MKPTAIAVRINIISFDYLTGLPHFHKMVFLPKFHCRVFYYHATISSYGDYTVMNIIAIVATPITMIVAIIMCGPQLIITTLTTCQLKKKMY